MQEFIVYKIPNQELQAKLGSWFISSDLKNSGFILSDAHGEKFWSFSQERTASFSDIHQPELISSNMPIISKEEYLSECDVLIDEMKSENMDKVVYSRVKFQDFDSKNFKLLFQKLCIHYPNNLNYCLYSEELGFWMGSTPEILIQGGAGKYTSIALAGTLPSSASDDLWTSKEFDEQQYVADYLEDKIEKLGRVVQKSDRFIHHAGPVKHLRNDFDFELSTAKLWDFILDFHPTPAVCGVPTQEAKRCYKRHEKHDRSLYTGIIGYSNEISTALFVNLRCMQLFKNGAALYVGGGLTQNSDPMKEWLETERKAEALGQFLK